MRRQLAAVLMADVAGYSRLMGADEMGAARRVRARLGELSSSARAYGGEAREIGGDRAFVLFPSAVDAVSYAIAMQGRLGDMNAAEPALEAIEMRMGINVGEILYDGQDVAGDAINVAARLESFAEPGHVCISEAVHRHVAHRLTYGYEYLGAQSFKNIERSVEVFAVREDPASAALICALRPSPSPRGAAERAPDLSVVVLPFRFQGEEAGDRWFADGLTEDVTTALSRFHEFFVIARGSAQVLAERGASPTEAAGRLGVRYAVQGSVRKAGRRIRVAIELLDAAEDRMLWGERYDREIGDIFDLQDEITGIVVSATAAQIEATERERLRNVAPGNLAAYAYVLQGRRLVDRYTRGEVRRAREMFERALEGDPDYARALAAMAETRNLDWLYGWADDQSTALDDALSLARDAISLDGRDARGFGQLGFAHLYRKEHDAALSAYERARGLNPNDADLMSDMADALSHAGRSEEAVTLLQRAMRLNPFYPDQYVWHLGGAYFNLRRYEEAVSTLLTMQNPTEGRRLLAASYAYLGREREARAEAERLREAHPDFSVDHWAQVLPDRHEEDALHYVEGLRMAGL